MTFTAIIHSKDKKMEKNVDEFTQIDLYEEKNNELVQLSKEDLSKQKFFISEGLED